MGVHYTNRQSAYKPFLHVQRDEPHLPATKNLPILAELSDTLLEINQLFAHGLKISATVLNRTQI